MMPLIFVSRSGPITFADPAAPEAADPVREVPLRLAAGIFVVLPDWTVDGEPACAMEWTPTGSATARRPTDAAMMSGRRRRNARERTRAPPGRKGGRSGSRGLRICIVRHASLRTYAEALNPLYRGPTKESNCRTRCPADKPVGPAYASRGSLRSGWPIQEKKAFEDFSSGRSMRNGGRPASEATGGALRQTTGDCRLHLAAQLCRHIS